MSFYYRVTGPKDADGMANSVDPDQTALQPDLGLHCLRRSVSLKTSDHFGKLCPFSNIKLSDFFVQLTKFQ